MNHFPFAPFFIVLKEEGFCITLDDYRRISTALKADESWDIGKVRSVLIALIVKNEDQKELFIRCFDRFFDLPDEKTALFSDIDLDLALEDIRTLAEGKSGRGYKYRKPLLSGRVGRVLSHSGEKEKKGIWSWGALFLGFLLILSAGLLWFDYAFQDKFEPEKVVILPPVPVKPEDKNIDESEFVVKKKEDLRYRVYKNVPSIKTIKNVSPVGLEQWKLFSCASFVILAAVLAYAVYLWKTHKIPKDRPPVWNDKAPRHFRLGTIAKDVPPVLDSETLDTLADFLGYFQSGLPGKTLDVSASIKHTINEGGIPSPVFCKHRQIYNVLILEDECTQALAWNPIARELARGLEKRGVPVVYGKFYGSPGQFTKPDGSAFHMEDIEDQRRGYLVLIFSDGKGLHRQQDEFALESLARWPMIAWMEMRDVLFWDESTNWPVSLGIPVYPANSEGLVLAMGRFLTEHGNLGNEESGRSAACQVVPKSVGKNIPAYVERVTGNALIWAQACSMIQPVSIGMADSLRRRFHPDLSYESIERLFALPGTLQTVSGLRFSTKVLSVLRSGFVVRRNDEQQEEVLRFILEKIGEAEPKQAGSPAHLAWEWQYRRVQLELEPEKALKRLAQLGADKSPLGAFVKSEMANITLPAGDLADKNNFLTVPLRVRPEGRFALQRLARIAKKSGVGIRESFPVAKKHWLAISGLVFCFIGALFWSFEKYLEFSESKVVLTLVSRDLKDVPVKIEIGDENDWRVLDRFESGAVFLIQSKNIKQRQVVPSVHLFLSVPFLHLKVYPSIVHIP
ncbi:hypothetical protein QUF76_09560, partial [Desulfobacterales bacterium HSG16]|nr:hypothetical protein [Desulfobacterales bacterium HSG16]